MNLRVVNLGLIDYQDALELQFKLLALRQQNKIEDILLLLEHPPVITVGVNGKDANILVNEEFLKSKGIGLYHVNRGGDVTYHGPGQIVGYPILHLNNHGRNVKDYVRRLEETFICLLQDEYGIQAERNPRNNGTWVGHEKITAVGCAIKRWVTMHGFAFNVNTNLEHFRWINPCGLTDAAVVSLEKLLGEKQDLIKVEAQVVKHFSRQFHLEPQNQEKTEFLKDIRDIEVLSA